MSMRKSFRILAVAVCVMATLTGCRSLGFYGRYDYSFVGVSDYNLTDTVAVEDGVHYSDSLIDIRWTIVNSTFTFNLTNNTNENIEIDWRKVSFISPAGNISRSAVEFNSFIPPKTSMNQTLRWTRFAPAAMVNMAPYNYTIWSTYRIIEIRPTYYIAVRDAWKDMLGTQFSVYFPMKIKGKEYNYRFIFEASELHVNQQAPPASYSVRKGEDFPKGYRTLEEIKNTDWGRVRVEKQ